MRVARRLRSALKRDPGGAVFLALLLAVATLGPALNQAVPASSALHLSTPGLPWFYLVDTRGDPRDGISADEWDDNDASEIAPVLESFLKGCRFVGQGTSPSARNGPKNICPGSTALRTASGLPASLAPSPSRPINLVLEPT